jgi:hypothetical protein
MLYSLAEIKSLEKASRIHFSYLAYLSLIWGKKYYDFLTAQQHRAIAGGIHLMKRMRRIMALLCL